MVLVLWRHGFGQLIVCVGTIGWLYPDSRGCVNGFSDFFNHGVYNQFTLLHRSRIGKSEEGGDSDNADGLHLDWTENSVS